MYATACSTPRLRQVVAPDQTHTNFICEVSILSMQGTPYHRGHSSAGPGGSGTAPRCALCRGRAVRYVFYMWMRQNYYAYT